MSVNPFIDTPDRQRGYGGLVVANERRVVSGPGPQPEKKVSGIAMRSCGSTNSDPLR
jgi:hypothetical protein